MLAGIVKPDELVRRPTVIVAAPVNGITVIELLSAFWKHVQTYYVDRNGKVSTEGLNFHILIALRYGHLDRIEVAEHIE